MDFLGIVLNVKLEDVIFLRSVLVLIEIGITREEVVAESNYKVSSLRTVLFFSNPKRTTVLN